MSKNPVIQREYRIGYGYSPASTGPVGGWPTGTQFFGQKLSTIIPNGQLPVNKSFFFGKRKKKMRKRAFGSECNINPMPPYPLMNLPNKQYDLTTFPAYPVGKGNTPGGSAGSVWFPMIPSPQQYWGYGKHRKSKRKSKRRKSKHNK